MFTNKFQEALDKIESLRKTTKRNEKKILLKEFFKDEFFKKVVKYTLDDSYHYNINKIPNFELSDVRFKDNEEESFFKYLDFLRYKKGATDSDKQVLFDIFNANKAIYEIGKLIIKKDLKCGVGVKIVNAAHKDLVEIFPYMRCSSKSKLDKITYPCSAQQKEDGFFIAIIKKGDNVIHRTRNGSFLHLHDNFKKEFEKFDGDFVLIGECLAVDEFGNDLDRSEINGFCTKAIAGTLTEEEASRLKLVLWDRIDFDEFFENVKPKEKLYDRLEKLKNILLLEDKRISLVEEKIIYSKEELEEYFKFHTSQGHEGIIAKNFSNVWKNGTATDQVKLKTEATCELRIVGWNFGEEGSKYQHCMATFLCENDENTVVVNVGSGFKDEERGFLGLDENGNVIEGMSEEAKDFCNSCIGKIVEVKYYGVTKDRNNDFHSLSHPIFVAMRDDKNETDSLERINDMLKL